MILAILTLLTAVAISGVAAYFSVVGLIAIFAAASLPIAVMGSVLEVAKLVSASWVYRNWSTAPKVIKYYLTVAVVVLSLITSMGIFGYLSKAHLDQNLPTGDVQAKVSLIDEKIRISKDNIDVNRKALKQLDESVDQLLARSKSEEGAAKAAQLRTSQQRERARLLTEIQQEQKKIASYNEERAPIATELRKVEAEVGPLKYIAALIYDDNPDTNTLEKAVRWVIISLIFVFDPLAILLLIAANISFANATRGPPVTSNPPDGEEEEEVNLFEEQEEDKSKQEVTKQEEAVTPEKKKWSKELYKRLRTSPTEIRIQKSRIHEVPKEILDKVFRK